MPKLTVLLSDEQHIAIKIKAAQARLSQTEIARRLLMAWLKDEVGLPTESGQPEADILPAEAPANRPIAGPQAVQAKNAPNKKKRKKRKR